jgi:hypothetical protein
LAHGDYKRSGHPDKQHRIPHNRPRFSWRREIFIARLYSEADADLYALLMDIPAI